MKNEKVIQDMNVSELVIETSKNFGGEHQKIRFICWWGT